MEVLNVEGMSRAARSLFVFGVYLCGLGLLLLPVPNLLLPLVGAPATNEVWIRINGMLVLCLSFYYVQAARHGLAGFIRWTIWARLGGFAARRARWCEGFSWAKKSQFVSRPLPTWTSCKQALTSRPESWSVK